MTSATRLDERGYVLLAMLWISVGITGLALVIAQAARDAIAPARNRIALAAAEWTASGCLARAREAVARTLEQETAQPGAASPAAWDRVDRTLQASQSSSRTDCRLSARPVGARLDLNATDETTLARLFRLVGMRAGRADSAAMAVAARRPYVDLRQVHAIPGLESLTVLDSVLDIEPGAISLNHASGPLLALLPGFTPETVQRVLEARARDAPISSFLELSALLSPDSPEASARLPGVVVFPPTAWVITVRASAGQPAVTVVIEARLLRSKTTSIARRRSWIE